MGSKLPPEANHNAQALRQQQRVAAPAPERYHGTICSVNAARHSYEVSSKGRPPARNVPRMQSSPAAQDLLEVGTVVAIDTTYTGQPLIVGVIPQAQLTPNTGVSVTNVDPDVAEDTGGVGYYHDPNTPSDIRDGDYARVCPDGTAAVALLNGGVAVLQGGSARIAAQLIDAALDMKCRNLRLETDMGTLEMTNKDGRTGLTFRGGSDHYNESGQGQWSIDYALGAGGNVSRFSVRKAGGKCVYESHVDAEGNWAVTQQGDNNFMAVGHLIQRTLSNRELHVAGTDTRDVKGAQSLRVSADRKVRVTSNGTDFVGNDRTEATMRNKVVSVGGSMEDSYGAGDPLKATSSDVARKTTLHASWEVGIGRSGVNNVKNVDAHFDMTVEKGDITHTTKKGDVRYATEKGDASVIADGGNANVDAGSDVLLGDRVIAKTNAVLKGKIHNTGFDTFLTTRMAARPTYLSLTQAHAATLMPPLLVLYIIPVVGPMIFFALSAPLWLARSQAEFASVTANQAADVALQAALPGMLSQKVFTE